MAGSPGSPDIETEPAVAVDVFGDRIDHARRYVAALATGGLIRGLIGPRESQRLWSRHVLNSAVVGTLIDEGATVVDIGSGAGLPGIPLAIARPDLRVTLVEPLERRVTFLAEVLAELELTGCRVIRGRAEDVIAECGNSDVVTSRAVAPLHRLAAWSAPLARDGGWVLALKGASAAQELERDRSAVTAAGLVDAEVLALDAGRETGAERTFVIRARRKAAQSARPTRPSPRSGRRRAGR